MSAYQFTPQAVDDLFEIWSYIARSDLSAANRFEGAIHRACSLAVDAPLAGSQRDD